MSVKKAVILCGGLATRMLPITKSIPKEMFPLLDKPIIQHILEDLKSVGVEEAALIVSDRKQCIKDYFGADDNLINELVAKNKITEANMVKELENILPITYITQEKPKGTMDAVYIAKKFVDNQPFFLFFGDEYLLAPNNNVAKQLLKAYNTEAHNILAIQAVDDSQVHKYGIVKPTSNHPYFGIEYMVEKPKREEAPSNLSYIGPAILQSNIFAYMEQRLGTTDKEQYITEAYQLLAQQQDLYGLTIDGLRLDLGSKLGFIQSNVLASLQHPEYKDAMKAFLQNLDLTK